MSFKKLPFEQIKRNEEIVVGRSIYDFSGWGELDRLRCLRTEKDFYRAEEEYDADDASTSIVGNKIRWLQLSENQDSTLAGQVYPDFLWRMD